MTEAEWLTSTDPTPMLAFLRGRASERMSRLFAVACCRRIWDVLSDEAGRNAVGVAECAFAPTALRGHVHAAYDIQLVPRAADTGKVAVPRRGGPRRRSTVRRTGRSPPKTYNRGWGIDIK